MSVPTPKILRITPARYCMDAQGQCEIYAGMGLQCSVSVIMYDSKAHQTSYKDCFRVAKAALDIHGSIPTVVKFISTNYGKAYGLEDIADRDKRYELSRLLETRGDPFVHTLRPNKQRLSRLSGRQDFFAVMDTQYVQTYNGVGGGVLNYNQTLSAVYRQIKREEKYELLESSP